ncbi:MAG: 4Fe-4S dicluster domain-containing protein [Planctomycetia bacterium]|nr:4Fe-4S dicluster domain-containing protein [Planctomycetia bacterium]
MAEENKIERKENGRRRFLKTGALAAGAAITLPSVSLGEALFPVTTPGKNHRYGFLIDLKKCIGCKACAVACKTEFEMPLGEFRSSVKELDEGQYPDLKRSFLPWLCNHCKNPICLKNCPVDEIDAEFVWPDGTVQKYKKRATYQRPDGVVLIDYDRCVGCGNCVDDCPYGVRFLNPAKETVSDDAVDDFTADKCTLCAHRIDVGLQPACVNTCQAEARVFGDLNDPKSKISKILKLNKVDVLLPEKGTKPQCSYVALNPNIYSKGRDTK